MALHEAAHAGESDCLQRGLQQPLSLCPVCLAPCSEP